MSQEPKDPDMSRLQHEAEHTKPKSSHSVVSYIAILFAAAFLLLLLSYLMQQRNNAEVISGLTDSVSAMQTLDNLIQENKQLEEQVTALEENADVQQQSLDAAKAREDILQRENEELRKQTQALDYLREIQRLYALQSYRKAREVISAFEEAGLVPYLPTQATYQTEKQDRPSPAETYANIYEALF